MEVIRTLPIVIPQDSDLIETVQAYTRARNIASVLCYNGGNAPLKRTELHEAAYTRIREETGLASQLTCSVLRSVFGAYQSQKTSLFVHGRHPKRGPLVFRKEQALFLVGPRGRDARLRDDNTLTISTLRGRATLPYRIPEGLLGDFDARTEVKSVTVSLRYGKPVARIAIGLEVPEPSGARPVGVDLNESNLVVAVDGEGRDFMFDGRPLKARNKRTRQTRKRLQRKMAVLKAQGKDTHSVRRALKRLGSHEANRTRTTCRLAAARLVEWTGKDSVMVLEDLRLPQQSGKDRTRTKDTHRRLTRFPYGSLRRAIEGRCEREGIPVTLVNPNGTSRVCSACGAAGERHRHNFVCPTCGHADHADLNAAKNIRDRFVGLRPDGDRPASPEARSCGQAA